MDENLIDPSLKHSVMKYISEWRMILFSNVWSIDIDENAYFFHLFICCSPNSKPRELNWTAFVWLCLRQHHQCGAAELKTTRSDCVRIALLEIECSLQFRCLQPAPTITSLTVIHFLSPWNIPRSLTAELRPDLSPSSVISPFTEFITFPCTSWILKFFVFSVILCHSPLLTSEAHLCHTKTRTRTTLFISSTLTFVSNSIFLSLHSFLFLSHVIRFIYSFFSSILCTRRPASRLTRTIISILSGMRDSISQRQSPRLPIFLNSISVVFPRMRTRRVRAAAKHKVGSQLKLCTDNNKMIENRSNQWKDKSKTAKTVF